MYLLVFSWEELLLLLFSFYYYKNIILEDLQYVPSFQDEKNGLELDNYMVH